MKKLIVILFVVFTFSCNETKKETTTNEVHIEKPEVAANYKSIVVDIEGMTCEIGCAKTIESKLSKFEGVTYSKVNFETKKGQFTFDANKTDKEAIVAKITGIAGGDLYSVTKTQELNEVLKNTK
ncbi:heavy metal-associated domain-containing protein [uncultured Lutibacter sp.]|uniref:cation transporter n=1 Tax=uncultured Lutibacter sp. TaxID=437739 RepID=UPI002625827E|nr:heavy metal-associated domain-containing protein [uncultured Lutibacter sp.]